MTERFVDKITRPPKTPVGLTGKVLTSRIGTEFAASVAFYGSLIGFNALFKHELDSLKRVVAKQIVAPHLSSFEKLADRFPALEGPENAEIRRNMSDEDKALTFASTIVDYSIKGTASATTQTLVQKMCDKYMGLPTEELKLGPYVMSTVADRGTQAGAFIVMNTAGKGANVAMQKSLAGFCEKRLGWLGFSQKNSESFARDLVNFQLPNAAGMLGATTALSRVYYKALAEQGHWKK